VIKPALAVLGVGMIVLGAYLVGRIVWLGGSEIVIGLFALLALSARPKSATYAAGVLGIATLLMWLVAVARGLVGWLSSLTFLGGIAFVLASVVAYRAALPAGPPGSSER
jgi:hypothetical protein